MWTSGPSSTKPFLFLPCIWHVSVLKPPPVKDCNFSFYFVFLAYSRLFHSPHLTRTSGPLSRKQFLFLACIWHINALGIALTSHVVKSIHRNTHTCSPDLCPRATLVCVALSHRLASLCRDLSTHVLVCLNTLCSVHTAWMTFGPLSTVSTWGTARATAVG